MRSDELQKIKIILELMVEKGYLDKVGELYCDSWITKQMLEDGLTRKEITFILEKEWSKEYA